MATQTMTTNPFTFTNSADTSDHDLDCSSFIKGNDAVLEVYVVGAANVRFSQFGQATSASTSPTFTSTDGKLRFDVNKDSTFHYRGGAGSEVLKVKVVNAIG